MAKGQSTGGGKGDVAEPRCRCVRGILYRVAHAVVIRALAVLISPGLVGDLKLMCPMGDTGGGRGRRQGGTHTLGEDGREMHVKVSVGVRGFVGESEIGQGGR